MTIFWDVSLSNLVDETDQRFRGVYCLCHENNQSGVRTFKKQFANFETQREFVVQYIEIFTLHGKSVVNNFKNGNQ
jgi:hypothetical protein